MTSPVVEYRILIVDDDENLAESYATLMRDELADLGIINVETEHDFVSAERKLEKGEFDLVILDVRDDNPGTDDSLNQEFGRTVYERIAKKCWTPAIFCTGFTQRVEDLERPPLVKVVTKNELEDLVESARMALKSGIPGISRKISGITDGFVRAFLRDTIAPNWQSMADSDHEEISYALVNQLAAWLKENAVRELDSVLPDGGGSAVSHASAARVYLKPPVTAHLTAADILRDPEKDYWVVMTPACDLYEDPADAPHGRKRTAKAEFVRMIRAHELEKAPPVAAWKDKKLKKEHTIEIFKTRNNRYRALPKYIDIPDLLVDLEDVQSVRLQEAQGWDRIATLDSPFAEELLTWHSRSVGRIGIPDLNWEQVMASLGLRKRGAEA